MINGKHGQGTHCTKMGADKSAENTPNAPKFICPNCLPKHRSLRFSWKIWCPLSVIATIGIMEKYTGQTFIIDTYEKNDNNSMRLDPLCNFCLHFQISGAGVNISNNCGQRMTFYHNLSNLPH